MAAATIQRKKRSRSIVVMALARGRFRSARAWAGVDDAQPRPPGLGRPGHDDGRGRRRPTEDQVLCVGQGDEHGGDACPHSDACTRPTTSKVLPAEAKHVADSAAGPLVEHGLAGAPRLAALPTAGMPRLSGRAPTR